MLEVYYHACLMPTWRKIVEEQLRLAKFVGLNRIYCGVLGPKKDRNELPGFGKALGVDLIEVYYSENFKECEMPTLHKLWIASQQRPEHAYLYWHTKGVSKPLNRNRIHWRRVMQKYVVAKWQENLKWLEGCDVVGVNWQRTNPWIQRVGGIPHFQGNFWMANGAHIAKLQDPLQYDRDHNWRRFAAEFWVGSTSPRIYSHWIKNQRWGRGDRLFDIPVEIEGFHYA